jgi:undecaprenyl-diphosphatase
MPSSSGDHDSPTLFGRIRAFDHRFINEVAALDQRGPARRWMLAATRAGDGWALLAIIPAALVIGGARGFAVVCCGVVSQVALAIVVQSIKAVFRRDRPSGLAIEDPIGAPDKHAFPSGHTAQSFGIMVLAFWLSPWLGLVLAPLALTVAASRMYFGLHYPSDVVVGAVLGCLMTALTLTVAQASGLVDYLLRISPLA